INEPMSLNMMEDVAIIKIPSFANSYLKKHQQHFKKEIKSFMKELQKNNIKQLLIDLRGNTGGSDSNPAFLSSYFFEEEYEYWESIEVSPALAKDVSGINRIFYGKPSYQEGKWLWSDKGLLSKEFKFTRIQEPAKAPFKGELYMLTDGLCLSSSADFAAIMQANQKALIIGEESGGGYQGNTSGLIPSQELACGLVIDVPLLKYINAVPADRNYARGTIPDIELLPSLEELEEDASYLKRVIEEIKKEKEK
ncbi:MAG: S41 family peptidase, partial [Bacteroidota bacterium]